MASSGHLSCSSILALSSSNNSIHAVAVADDFRIYCALLVPSVLLDDFLQAFSVILYPSVSVGVGLQIKANLLTTKRTLVSSISFVLPLDKPLSLHYAPSLSFEKVPGGLTVPIAILPGKLRLNPSNPILTSTLVGSDSYLCSSYLRYGKPLRSPNHIIFTDQRMQPLAAAQILQACSQDSIDHVTVFPVASPYYYILDYNDLTTHTRPADSRFIKQQSDYYFILLPLTCMLAHLMACYSRAKYITFCDMDERHIYSDSFMRYLRETTGSSHLLIEEVNVYAHPSIGRITLNSLTPNDLIFPFGRFLRNRKTVFYAQDLSRALDSPHGITEDYSRYQVIELASAFYLHFFNVTRYKRLDFRDCSRKVNRSFNFRASQISIKLLNDFRLGLLAEFPRG